MSEKIKVETQGISDDWMTANGHFETLSRGAVDRVQILSVLRHVQPLDMPDGEDMCPPHVLTEGPAGTFSFIGQGGTLYCPDVEQELDASKAADLALGQITIAPPPAAAPSSVTTDPAHDIPAALSDPDFMQRKLSPGGVFLLLLGTLFLLGAVMAIITAITMTERGVTGDDFWAVWTMGGMSGLIGALMVTLAFKRRSYVDANGKVLPYVLMGQILGSASFDKDYSDVD